MIPPLRRLPHSLALLVLTVLGFGILPVVAAESTTSRFDAANLLYEKGEYRDAAAAYDALIADGTRTSALLFNSGNAHFKSGEVGLGVSHWLQAQAIDPRNHRIQINLEFARRTITGGAEPLPLWPDQLKVLTLNEWGAITLAAIWLCFTCLALAIWKPKWRPGLRVPAVLAGIAFLLSATLLFITARDRFTTMTAVVTRPEAVVRFGPLSESQSAFVAKDGAVFRVSDRKGDWLRVEDATGRDGWILAEQVTLLLGGRPTTL